MTVAKPTIRATSRILLLEGGSLDRVRSWKSDADWDNRVSSLTAENVAWLESESWLLLPHMQDRIPDLLYPFRYWRVGAYRGDSLLSGARDDCAFLIFPSTWLRAKLMRLESGMGEPVSYLHADAAFPSPRSPHGADDGERQPPARAAPANHHSREQGGGDPRGVPRGGDAARRGRRLGRAPNRRRSLGPRRGRGALLFMLRFRGTR